MKKIAIIGANDFQNRIILKASNLGYETHVFAWKENSVGEKTADYFYPISITEKDKIYEIAQKIKPDAVVSIASDLAVPTVNYVSSKLNLTYNSKQSVLYSTNKFEMRKALQKAGLIVPRYIKIDNTYNIEQLDMKFPLIVKPTDRSGSRGIMKIENAKQFKTAVESAITCSFEKKAIVEEYIDGNEYSCECITFKGVHYLLAITKKYTTGQPHFIETGHSQPSELTEKDEAKIKSVVFCALDALNIEFGASHSEFKLNKNGDVIIIEIGSRMAGDCIGSDLVHLSTGYDYMKMVIDVSEGKIPCFDMICSPKFARIQFIFSKDDLNKFEKIKRISPEYIYRASDIIIPESNYEIADSSKRFGYYILASENKDKIEELIKI